MAKHTKGPWEVIGNAVMPDPDSRNPDSMMGICEVYEFDGDRPKARVEANARLIAAAPDLLTELKKLRLAYVNLMEIGRDRIMSLGGTCDPVDVMEAGDPALRSADAAILKATA